MSTTLDKPISPELKKLIEEKVYEKDGKKYIGLGSCRLDFKHEYEFLGYTKNQKKVKLSDGYKNSYGTIEVSTNGMDLDGGIAPCLVYTLMTDAWSYSETLKMVPTGKPKFYGRRIEN